MENMTSTSASHYHGRQPYGDSETYYLRPLDASPWSPLSSGSQGIASPWSPHSPGSQRIATHGRQLSDGWSPVSPRKAGWAPDMGPLSPPQMYTQSPQSYFPKRKPISVRSFSSEGNLSRQTIDTDASDAALLKGFGEPSATEARDCRPPQEPSRSTRCTPPTWNPIWSMYLLFVIGIAFAVAHHVFYSSLDGLQAALQLEMLRYGTVFAYLTKTSLVASCVIAYRQQMWYSFRTRPLTVPTIDSLFAVVEDFSGVFSWEAVRNAKLALVLAAVIWLIPIAAILSPATLTTAVRLHENSTTCPGIRTLDFDQESTKDFRVAYPKAGGNAYALSLWNTTDVNGTAPGFLDYWTKSSPFTESYVSIGAYEQKPAIKAGAATDICGSGWNCSFEIQFVGPGYQCKEHASGVGDNTQLLHDMDAPFDTSALIPQGTKGYYAVPMRGEYAVPQILAGEHGIPVGFNQSTSLPPNLGAFRTEPVIWMGYSVNTGKRAADGDPYANWTWEYTPKIFSCQHYETRYTVLLNYIAGQQHANVTNRIFLTPIVNTTFVPGMNASDGTLDTTYATPTSNYILPTPSSAVGLYRKTAAYHSLGLQLRTWLEGYVDYSNVSWPVSNTRASQTRLIDATSNYLPVKDLMEQVQGLYEDFLLSLLAYPSFVVVVNASSSDAPNSLYPCTKSRLLNTYVYHVRDLWLGYGAVILAAAGAIAVGAHAVRENGDRVRDARFSSIVASTRGSALEELGWKRWAAGGHVPRRAMSGIKLGFGRIPEDRGAEGEEYWGFGVEGNVRQLGPGRDVVGRAREYWLSRSSFG